MKLGLEGKVVIVTGAASGIGHACAAAMFKEGAFVALLDKNPAVEEVARSLDPDLVKAMCVPVNLTNEREVEDATRRVVERFGAIDSVIGCAGISGPVGERLSEISVEDWMNTLSVNVTGNFIVSKYAIPHLERSDVGTVVLVASDAAIVAFDGMAAYNTSKGAVVMLAKSIAVDHPTIRSNAICPGIVDTPMSRKDLGRETEGFEGSGLPVMHAGQLANHVMFLASPVSAPINATTLVADFGYLGRSAVGALEFAPES